MIENITTVRADSVDEAIEIALSRLELTRDEVDVHVISEGKKGFLGFGKQPAVVEVSAKELTVTNVAKQVVEEAIETSQAMNQEESIVSRQEEALFKQDEPAKDELKAEPQTAVVFEEVVEDIEEETPSLEPVEQKELSKEKDGYEIVTHYLEDILKEYGVEDATVSYERTGTQVVFNIETQKPGIVIGRQGKTLNALQVVAQILFHRYEPRRMSIILNVGDYRERREHALTKIAQRAARQVQKTKQSVILEPLPAYERKQIHAIISRYDNLTTQSEGKDPNRYLIIQYNEK